MAVATSNSVILSFFNGIMALWQKAFNWTIHFSKAAPFAYDDVLLLTQFDGPLLLTQFYWC